MKNELGKEKLVSLISSPAKVMEQIILKAILQDEEQEGDSEWLAWIYGGESRPDQPHSLL